MVYLINFTILLSYVKNYYLAKNNVINLLCAYHQVYSQSDPKITYSNQTDKILHIKNKKVVHGHFIKSTNFIFSPLIFIALSNTIMYNTGYFFVNSILSHAQANNTHNNFN